MVALIDAVFQIFSLLMLARILLSWIQLDPSNQFVQILHNITEPFLAPVRRILPPMGMLDLSPLVVLILAQVIAQILTGMVRSVGLR